MAGRRSLTILSFVTYIAVTAQGAPERQYAPHAYSNKSIQLLNGQKIDDALQVFRYLVDSTVKAEVTELVKYLSYLMFI
jgi:hypothetical protein